MAATQLEIVDTESGFVDLRGDWDELLQDSPADSFFLTWDWLHAWWLHLSGTRRLAVLTVRKGGRLIAAAPFAVGRGPRAGLLPTAVHQFIGSGDVGSDYFDVIVRHGFEVDAEAAVFGHLAARPLLLEAPRLAPRSWFASASRAMTTRGWRSATVATDVCPHIPLGGRTWGAYLQGLGASHRANFKRRFRKLSDVFVVQFERVQNEEQRADVLRTLVHLHNLRWRGRGGSTAFHSAALVRFHDDVTRRLLARGWLRLFVLRLDGEPAAVLYGIVYRNRFHFYQGGFDQRFAKHSVGLVLMGLAIKSAFDEQLVDFDLLHGDESYKSLWADASRELISIEIYPPRIRGWLCLAHVGAGRAMRRLARKLIDGLPSIGVIDGVRTRAVVPPSR